MVPTISWTEIMLVAVVVVVVILFWGFLIRLVGRAASKSDGKKGS